MQTQTSPSMHSPAARSSARAARSDEPRHRPVWNFTRHYLEMVAAMFLGMLVLGAALALALELAGVDVSDWRRDAPALLLFAMAFTMTAPMVAWMRHRGHGWAPAADMTAAMLLPTLVGVALLATGVVTDTHALLMIQHIAMGPAMLVAMLLRRHEYTAR